MLLKPAIEQAIRQIVAVLHDFHPADRKWLVKALVEDVRFAPLLPDAPGTPPQTCAAGSVPELLRELMDATNRLAFFGASVDASDGNGYNVKPIWRAMLRAFARERGIELDGKEKAASPSPPVIESGECGLTYQHYRTPDEVARRWKHALDLHREHVEHLFSEYEKGTISLDQVKHRAMMLVSPISDQDLRLATDEAVGIAEELHRESQPVGGESDAYASSVKTSQAIAQERDEGGV
jgi:hypothetical protein